MYMYVYTYIYIYIRVCYFYSYIHIHIYIHPYIYTYHIEGLLTLASMSEHQALSSRMSDSLFQLGAGCGSGRFPAFASWQGNG